MPEIKRELITDFTSARHHYIIDESHTLKDILRHVLHECGDADDFMYLCKEVYETESDGS